MIKNYLKVALRNLWKHKGYSVINITGLAIGLAACMLIVLYIGHENSFDHFHTHAERIFKAQTRLKLGADSFYLPLLPYATAPQLLQTEPSVEDFLRIKESGPNTVVQNAQVPSLKFAESKLLFADSNFFRFFSFQLKSGDKESVLKNPFSIVISEEAAKKYFASANPIGKTLRYNNSYDFVVTGVAKKQPSASTLRFDFVASSASLLSMIPEKELVAANENLFATFFRLRSENDASRLEDGLQRLEKGRQAASEVKSRYIATPLMAMHLTGNGTGSRKYLRTFGFVAALILLLAVVNYTSLSTARSATRAKEVGVRKVMGAGRGAVARQFFVESALYTSIAFLLGVALCLAAQPAFFRFLQIDVDTSFFYHPSILGSFALLFLLTLLLAALYPSAVLSAYKPVKVLYGKFVKEKGGFNIRNAFTIFQFTAAVALIICSAVVYSQLQFFRNTNTGVARENVLMLPFDAAAGPHQAAIKAQLQALPGVQGASVALHPLYSRFDMIGTQPVNSDKMVLLPALSVDQQFIPLLQLQWKAAPADSLFFSRKDVVVLNEQAAEELNFGNDLSAAKLDGQYEVAGVLKDFNYTSLQNKIGPLCLFITTDVDSTAKWTKNGGCFFLRLHPQTRLPALLKSAQAVLETYSKETPFSYRFMDEAFDEMYRAEDRLLKIVTAFTLLTVFIACLGLFGLAAFAVVQRTKEIGVRRVLGATVSNVAVLLSKDFLRPVFIATLIAVPLAWWLATQWLQDFAYRVSVGWWLYLSAGALVVFVALLTVSFQSVKAAMANPVKNLRSE